MNESIQMKFDSTLHYAHVGIMHTGQCNILIYIAFIYINFTRPNMYCMPIHLRNLFTPGFLIKFHKSGILLCAMHGRHSNGLSAKAKNCVAPDR